MRYAIAGLIFLGACATRDKQIPSLPRASTVRVDSANSKLTLLVLQMRKVPAPFTLAPGMCASNSLSSVSRSAPIRPEVITDFDASSAAAPIPTIWATGNVPARRWSCCLPPKNAG